MGVGFEGSSVSWSYTGFYQYRLLLRDKSGMPLEEQKDLSTSKDPIALFLSIPDVGGVIKSKDCKRVALRILELAADLPVGYHRDNTANLVSYMMTCYERGEDLCLV